VLGDDEDRLVEDAAAARQLDVGVREDELADRDVEREDL